MKARALGLVLPLALVACGPRSEPTDDPAPARSLPPPSGAPGAERVSIDDGAAPTATAAPPSAAQNSVEK
jgi:hypothetical protein